MTTKKSTSSVKKTTTTKKPAAKTAKPATTSAKARTKAKPKTGFLKTARVAVGEVVQTIADGAVQGVATAAKGLLEKQIGTTPKTANSPVKKAGSSTEKQAKGSTVKSAKKSTTSKRSAPKSRVSK